MITVELARDLFAHMEWADARMWAALPASAPPDDYLRQTLVHIQVVQRAFLEVWTRRPAVESLRTPDQFATLADVRSWAMPYYREAHAFLESVTPEQLAAPMVVPWSALIASHLGHEPAQTTLGETCFQVTSHTTHHRGQVNARLRAIGAEPPYVDYIVWLWQRRPAPVWQAMEAS